MNSPATALTPGRRRLAWIAAGILALLGLFAVTAPAHAGYYGEPYYGPRPCSYRCGYGYPRYRYEPYGYYHHCSACGCWRRCYSASRPPLLYERRYYEREYVVRRYGWPHHHYGYYPYYRHHYGYYPYGYRSWSRPFPYGYGGVRGWRTPYGYGYRYEPSYYRDEEPPRPPAPVWDGGGYEPVPYGDESAAHWGADRGDPPLQEPVAYGVANVSQPLPGGPLGMLASGLIGMLSLGVR
jgi:hypothetical protein